MRDEVSSDGLIETLFLFRGLYDEFRCNWQLNEVQEDCKINVNVWRAVGNIMIGWIWLDLSNVSSVVCMSSGFWINGDENFTHKIVRLAAVMTCR
jgi:hypothetical protein